MCVLFVDKIMHKSMQILGLFLLINVFHRKYAEDCNKANVYIGEYTGCNILEKIPL